MMNSWTYVIAVLTLLVVASCSRTDPHENFTNRLMKNIGLNADDPRSTTARYRRSTDGRTILDNGNIEIEFRGPGPVCRYFFEVDRDTNIIVAARFEGGERHCRIHP